MNTKEKIKNDIAELLSSHNHLMKLTNDDKRFPNFGAEYQLWYSKAYKVVEALAPERLSEFISYYLSNPKRKSFDVENFTIQDYIKQISPAYNKFDTHFCVVINLLNQQQILSSISSRIDSVLQDVKGHLFAELQDEELRAAAKLLSTSLRAAGSLAGVILERHLQQVAVNHTLKINKKNPTISDLNDPLKEAGVYDLPTWRKIQYLGDIRNKCSHEKGVEPTKEEVEELIGGVNSAIKNIF